MKYIISIVILVIVFYPLFAGIIGKNKEKGSLDSLKARLPEGILKSRILRGRSLQAAECLRPGADPEKAASVHVGRKLRLLYLCFAAGVCIICLYACFYQQPVLEGNLISRAQADGNARSVDLSVSLGEQEENVTVTVSPRRYDAREREELLQEVKDYIDRTVSADNRDLSHVDQPLFFAESYPGSPVRIEWMPEDYSLIGSDGSLGDFEKEILPAQTSVTAVIRYDTFEEEYQLPVTIIGHRMPGQEALHREIDAALARADEDSREEGALRLPERIAGMDADWQYQKSMRLPVLLLLLAGTAVLLLQRQENKLEKEMKKREEELEREYPVFVHRMVLMLGAGMTVRRGWETIIEEDKKEENQYLRSEMLYAVRRMHAGVPEIKVYQQFGRRLPGYAQFTQLLVQMIRKGSRGMQEMMMREAKEAQGKRREIAKRMGETAGMRLLFPMIMLLILVLIIVMAPAMLSM